MDVAGAYGGGKAGATFDPIQFVRRPQVVLRALCWVCIFSILSRNCFIDFSQIIFQIFNKYCIDVLYIHILYIYI